MAIILLPYQQKQKKLIIVFVLISFLIALVLFFGIGPGQKWTSNWLGATPAATTTEDGIDVDIDTDFFDDPRYSILEPFADEPIEPKDVGRHNPFEPF